MQGCRDTWQRETHISSVVNAPLIPPSQPLPLLNTARHVERKVNGGFDAPRNKLTDRFCGEHLVDQYTAERRNRAGFASIGQFKQGVAQWATVVNDDFGKFVQFLAGGMS